MISRLFVEGPGGISKEENCLDNSMMRISSAFSERNTFIFQTLNRIKTSMNNCICIDSSMINDVSRLVLEAKSRFNIGSNISRVATVQGKHRSPAATKPGCYAAPLRGALGKGSPRGARCLLNTGMTFL